MAQQSHVPKFGNWESDNIPYTAYFENARKERGGVRINPNDPEENPEAFMYMGEGLEINADYRAVQAPLHVNSSKSTSAVEKQHIEGHIRHRAHRRNPSDQQKNGNHRSIATESGSDSSNSNYSLRPSHRHERPDKKKSPAEGINSFSSSVAGHSRQRIGRYPSVDTHHRDASSIPKFGAWDDADPKSGEGFTVIFNKVKEEKQIASSHFPIVPPQPSYHSNAQRHGRPSSRSKICCCLFSSGGE